MAITVTYEQLDSGTDDGARICGAATNKFALWGKTPVVQPSGASQAAVTSTGVASAGAWGCAQMASLKSHVDDIKTLVHAIRTADVTVGVYKGSA